MGRSRLSRFGRKYAWEGTKHREQESTCGEEGVLACRCMASFVMSEPNQEKEVVPLKS